VILEILRSDVDFLATQGVMDYSLLMAIVREERDSESKGQDNSETIPEETEEEEEEDEEVVTSPHSGVLKSPKTPKNTS